MQNPNLIIFSGDPQEYEQTLRYSLKLKNEDTSLLKKKKKQFCAEFTRIT